MFNNKIFYVIILLIGSSIAHARGGACQESCQNSIASITAASGFGKAEVIGIICVCCIAVLIISIHIMSKK